MNEQTIDLARRDVRAVQSDDDIRRNQRVDRAINNNGEVIESQRYGSAWNDNNPLLIGTYHLWRDSAGKWRIKDGKASSDTDGDLFVPVPDLTFTSQWNGARPLKLGNYTFWVDGSNYFRIKLGTPTSATDGIAVGAGI